MRAEKEKLNHRDTEGTEEGKALPIIFTGGSLPGIRLGLKTMTRRVVRAPRGKALLWDLSRATAENVGYLKVPFCTRLEGWCDDPREDTRGRVFCPYGQIGDRLWVKEKWATSAALDHLRPSGMERGAGIAYEDNTCSVSDFEPLYARGRWRSPLYMPRWASRFTLQITDVRVERVQEISEADAVMEGVLTDAQAMGLKHPQGSHREGFRMVWDALNAKRGFGWDVNRWVWVVVFRRVGA